MTTRLVRIQLTIFGIITVPAVSAMAIYDLRVPAALGIGTYDVTADFASGGGIYPNANVTYLGVAVGRVTAVDIADGHVGVTVAMRLNKGTPLPADVTATVNSVSAIGEQYVDLVPGSDANVKVLRDGARIPRSHTAGGDIATLLRQADALVASVGDTRLQSLLAEAFKAFDGSGPDLARLIQAAQRLIQEANANWSQTADLLDRLGPFLDAQIRSGPSISSLANGLARFTTELHTADTQLRAVLHSAPATADTATATFDGIRPTFPVLAASLANIGRVGVIYHKSVEQVLVIMPATLAAMLTVGGGEPPEEGGKVDFKLSLDPPPCLTGFLPPPLTRSPAEVKPQEIPRDLYCKVPQNDPSAVRGARNYPCQEYPGKRAPTVALCRDPRGYVPLGNNPWRGPPVPPGTPVTNPRNIVPPNNYPMIPPQSDPDPGRPYPPGAVPPGQVPGPPPDWHHPLPQQPPPVDGPPPPPFTAWIPPGPFTPPDQPDSSAPPPRPPPAALGGFTTYDPRTGSFVTPQGEAGTLAVTPNLPPAETWVDLMLDPRPE
ncbi:MCE family protein [Mycobacterium sp. 94-17]|uniref:MCE family protein n=1 Tax=Mycobacterium sp. 94-17 TaxID=2986147 RepID=UPI002D1EB1D0|nr:MCE family protein [Mycobacterium sp. 94-17]MEB4209564.1 MCE family protein [Mycobacterium sp. 94-17]